MHHCVSVGHRCGNLVAEPLQGAGESFLQLGQLISCELLAPFTTAAGAQEPLAATEPLVKAVSKLYRICDFFDSDPDDPWDLVEGEFFEYEPGQARKRRFYEEGVMAIAKYLEETEGGSFLARLKEFFTHHRARVTRALVHRRIIQVTQDRAGLVIRGDLVFLQQRSVVRVLGTNGKGMAPPRPLWPAASQSG